MKFTPKQIEHLPDNYYVGKKRTIEPFLVGDKQCLSNRVTFEWTFEESKIIVNAIKSIARNLGEIE